jgi:hypothetical protein
MTLDAAQAENFTDAVSHAILTDEQEVEAILAQYRDMPLPEAQRLVTLLHQLRAAYAPVTPSKRFVQQLKQDLVGAPEHSLMYRLRQTPPRVRLAAIFAALLAFAAMFVSRRARLKGLRLFQPQ